MGIRVVVLDISGKYAEHFRDVYPQDLEQDITKRINDAIANEFADTTVLNDAANFKSFKRELASILDWFLESESGLLIINPNSFVVRRMEGKPFGGHAQTLADVTMVEVARIIAEHLLDDLQRAADQPQEGEARLFCWS